MHSQHTFPDFCNNENSQIVMEYMFWVQNGFSETGLFKKNEELWHDLHKWLMTTCGSPPQCSRMALAISKPKSMVRSSETHTTGHFSWFLFAHWHLRLGIDLGARDPPCGILIMISIFPVKCWKNNMRLLDGFFHTVWAARDFV